jgi:glyceraldehyde 3-phosphate dehydrogenase
MKDTPLRVAIHGFGRIGRTFFKTAQKYPSIQIVVVADLHPSETMSHLLRYDSIHGKWDGCHYADNVWTLENGNQIVYFQKSTSGEIPNWGDWNVDVVIESTGTIIKSIGLSEHLNAGASRVLLSAPSESPEVPMVVLGIGSDEWKSHDIISCASCTTNSAAHMIQLIDEICGIESSYITTVHSYTGDQRLHDAPHKDLRRGRGALQSIVPTTTGAAKALTRIFPHLSSKMGGCGMRVPVPDGSLTDITSVVRNPQSIEVINAAFQKASMGRWKDIVEYTEDPIVSSDIIDNPHSCVFDAGMTSVIGNMVKVVGWYDNEVGYSHRLCDVLMKWKN